MVTIAAFSGSVFPNTLSTLTTPYNLLTGVAVFLPIAGKHEWLLAFCTSLHGGGQFIFILFVIPERIGHQIIQIPVGRKHALQKIVAVNRSVMNASIIGIDQMAPFIRHEAVSARIVCALVPGQCLDAFQYLLIGHGTSFLLRGKIPAEKKASVIRADVFLGHEDIEISELRNRIGFRVSSGIIQRVRIVIFLERTQRINRPVQTEHTISIKTGIRL